jgi:hypothetical protein
MNNSERKEYIMPWKVETIMTQRTEFINLAIQEDANIRLL